MIVKTGLQDAAKNVRIYGTISAASSPSARPLHRRRASRITLPCPFFAPPSPIAFSPPPRSSSLCPPIAAVSWSARRFLLPLARCCAPPGVSPPPCPPLHVLFVIPTRSPHFVRGRRGGPHHRRARTAGRDCPHRRGHHFNVTLIKSNNQYLPRKKF